VVFASLVPDPLDRRCPEFPNSGLLTLSSPSPFYELTVIDQARHTRAFLVICSFFLTRTICQLKQEPGKIIKSPFDEL